MFRYDLENVNENNYNVKIIRSGKNLKVKSFDTIQTRKKVVNDLKRYDVLTDSLQFFNTHTGEVYSENEWELMYHQKTISKEQYFFTKEKFLYHSMTKIERKIRNKVISLRRSKERIVNLINANVNISKEKTKFLTLTFKENITDVKTANTLFKNFMKRLNYFLKKQGNESVKYISVLENQERGAIHYHIILFNVPFVKFEDYKKIWGLGSVYIESLMKNDKIVKVDCENGDFKIGSEKINNIGAYVTKTIDYITKSFKDLENNLDELSNKTDGELSVLFTENAKIFQTSKNLEQPKEFYFTVNKNFEKFYKYLNLFFINELQYSEFENELFLLETYEVNYDNGYLEELDEFLRVLEELA